MALAADLFLGLDAGGTKTHAVVLDACGEVVAEAWGGPGNPSSAGPRVALDNLAAVVHEAMAPFPQRSPTRAHFGFAGAGRPAGRASVRDMIESLELDCPTAFSDDAKPAFYAAADPPGAVLICGTGSMAAFYDDAGRERRAGGHGYLVGDEGSGYWIGREAIRAGLRSSDGRDPPGDLAGAVPGLLGLGSIDDVIDGVYGGDLGIKEIAALGGRLLEDRPPAVEPIAGAAAEELVRALSATLPEDPVRGLPLVLSGGLIAGKDRPLRRLVEDRLAAVGLRFSLMPATRAPAHGAARLARSEVP